ncbi:MAG: hypothetical protein KC502_10265 [Myxococcales bacterium]|nr:hypothetical protein [Myxococcales bacterium]
MMRRVLSVCFVMLIGACSSPSGGGGGGGTFTAGGAPNTACDAALYGQGCSGTMRVTCSPDTNTWKPLGVCAAGQTCIGKPDPSDPQNFKQLAECIEVSSAADAGNTGTDATTSSDAVVAGDGGSAIDSGGTVGVDVGAPDSGSSGGAWLSCVQGKCSSQWGACSAQATCKTAALCVDGCAGDKKCQQICFDNTTGAAQDALISVIMCADQTGCQASTTGPKCGDGKCDAGESTATCPGDCKPAGPKCGDGKCDEGENSETCSADCKPVGPQCGNNKCEAGETPQSCLADCKPQCGDGKCEFGESKNTCAQDCGPTTQCGNGQCETGETAQTCPVDCAPKPVCGNGKCETGETASSCKADCGGSGSCIETKCGTQLKTCTNNPKCTALVMFGALQSCIEVNKCKDSACLSSKCAQEGSGCQNDASCNALWSCLSNCKTESCQQACLDQTALTQYDAVAKCANTNCSNG